MSCGCNRRARVRLLQWSARCRCWERSFERRSGPSIVASLAPAAAYRRPARLAAPDVAIVDSEADAHATRGRIYHTYLRHNMPLLHISVKEHSLRLLAHGEWEVVSPVEGPTPDAVRNVVAGVLFARHGR